MSAGFMSCTGRGSSVSAAAKDDGRILVFVASRGEEESRLEEIIKLFNEKTVCNVVFEGSPEFETLIKV